MKFKTKLIMCFIAIGIFICFIAVFLFNQFFNKSVALSFDVEPISKINYNNYLQENTIDYTENGFCYISKSLFGSNLNIVDKNNNTKKSKELHHLFSYMMMRYFILKTKP